MPKVREGVLTLADKGKGSVWEMLKLADNGEGGGGLTNPPKIP